MDDISASIIMDHLIITIRKKYSATLIRDLMKPANSLLMLNSSTSPGALQSLISMLMKMKKQFQTAIRSLPFIFIKQIAAVLK
jgi:hypothetical protein